VLWSHVKDTFGSEILYFPLPLKETFLGRQNTQQNDIEHNDTLRNNYILNECADNTDCACGGGGSGDGGGSSMSREVFSRRR
jgi:hypothetical protein